MRKLWLLSVVVSLLQLQACCAACKQCKNLHRVCCENAHAITDETMNRLEGSLVDLSKEVAGLLWSEAVMPEGVLATALQKKPHLRDAFKGYKLDVRVVGDNAVLLLCSADGRRALVEDVTCTAAPDFRAWAECNNLPCTFTLSDEEIRARICLSARPE